MPLRDARSVAGLRRIGPRRLLQGAAPGAFDGLAPPPPPDLVEGLSARHTADPWGRGACETIARGLAGEADPGPRPQRRSPRRRPLDAARPAGRRRPHG